MSLIASKLYAEASGRIILDVPEVTFERPGLTAIIGPNGSGKTTLLRALLGTIPQPQGLVGIEDRQLSDHSPQERARLIAYMPQKTVLAWPLPVHTVVALGRFAYGAVPQRLTPEDQARVKRVLAGVGLWERKEQSASTLSGGEFAKLMVARALAAETPYLLADEPAAALDPAQQHQVLSLLRKKADEGACVVVIVHDLSLAKDYADHVALMNEGRILATGSPTDVLVPDLLAKVYGQAPLIGPQGITFPRPS
ncbi:ABC transporter ATP-binding protein [Parvularcula maris]|uniref:ABC transporter ATP-binding protein n=1 Tax=Parvularcula maris TaxID=2965077 RepID=A0A9X2LAA1_9PROT|nr:ABC transporter ATP-binding protein [Parvularcula maris]MCQ8185974.1 ABC transporter ATP-binding protein [Parvularcula maris]